MTRHLDRSNAQPHQSLTRKRSPVRGSVPPTFWGDSNERDAVRRFHPAGITAISRGLSVRDTPGGEFLNRDLHPEGMLAGFRCQPDVTVLASLQDANHLIRTLPGVSLRSTPG